MRLYGEMHRFLPVYVSWHGARITEVEVRHYARTSGQSKYGLERVLKVLADLLVVKFLDRFQQKPMYVFGAVGLALVFHQRPRRRLDALWRKLGRGRVVHRKSAAPSLRAHRHDGLMCLLMGLLAEMIMRTFYESQGKSVYLIRACATWRRSLSTPRLGQRPDHRAAAAARVPAASGAQASLPVPSPRRLQPAQNVASRRLASSIPSGMLGPG